MHTVRYAIVRTLAAATALTVPFLLGLTPAYAASWQIVASPNPTGNDGFSTLTAISASNLWAVGSATSLSSTSATLIAHYNGTSWQVVPSPNPAGGRYDDLTGVSATSASDIWSVGMEFVNSSHSFPIIEHYNGTAWSLIPSAQPTQVGDLEAVAALTPANVWAVGDGHNPAGVNIPMVQHYNGTSWTEVPTSVTTAGLLTAVTAVSAGNVWAVGSRPVTTGIGRSGLAMHYNGTNWTASPLPAPRVPVNGEWELSAISADTANDVWATGFVSNADGLVEHAIVEHFNGTKWSLTRAPDLGPNYPINTFNAVLAISPGNVWAIGQSATGNTTLPFATLVEHFNGTRWTVQPAPANGANNVLSFDGLVTTGSGTLWSVGSRNPNGTANWQTLTARYS
jgi:hypothetical protein